MKTVRKNGVDTQVAAISNENYACSMCKLLKADLVLPKEVYVNRVLDLLYTGTEQQFAEGTRWYGVRIDDLIAYGVDRGWDPRIVIAVTALATQVVSWKQTVGVVKKFLDGNLWQYCGHPLWASIAPKLEAILADPECAPAQMGQRSKIPAIFAGFSTHGHTDTVCFDRWMFRVFHGFRVDKFDDAMYAHAEEVWAEVLSIVNEQRRIAGLPHLWGAQLQAILWGIIRDLPEWDEEHGSKMLEAPAWKNDAAARADALRAAKKAEAAAKKEAAAAKRAAKQAVTC